MNVRSGRLHARSFGSSDASAVVCLPGLAANAVSFDFIGERLGGRKWQVISLDLRGRGHSETTPAGSYGWPSHARDVLEVVQKLGFSRVMLIGHSMGAFVAMQAAKQNPGCVERLVLLDGLGVPDSSASLSLAAGADRPGRVYSSVDEYMTVAEARVTPWNGYWRRYFLEDLMPVAGGFKARPDRSAVLEDIAYAGIHDPAELWPALTMPVLLLRACLPTGGGHIVTGPIAQEFRRQVRQARVVEVDADHYGILMHPHTPVAIRRFLESRD